MKKEYIGFSIKMLAFGRTAMGDGSARVEMTHHIRDGKPVSEVVYVKEGDTISFGDTRTLFPSSKKHV